MKIKDSLKLALNSIIHRKLRSWLTLLGVVIGVAALVSIVSIGEGAQASVASQLSGLGADVITITPGFTSASSFGGNFRPREDFNPGQESTNTDTPTLTKNDLSVIKANPNIVSVNENVSGRGSLVFLAEKSNVTVNGVNPLTWKDFTSVELASGRMLSASDSTAIVIGDRVANSMFKQKITLGRTIAINDKAFTIVGILKASGSSFGGSGDSTIYMPINSAWTILDNEKDTYSSIQIKASSAEIIEQVTAELTQSLLFSRKVNEKNQDFTITSSAAIKEQVSSVTDTLTLFLGAIAAISLIVGAIGVANSMFTSVLEKTRLIGILKALGSTKKEILTVFLIESGLFGLIGGIIGVLLGMVISSAMSSFGIISLPTGGGGRGGGFMSTTLVTPELVIMAIAISTLVGIVSGLIPAKIASELKPVEALRYE